jgi:hypothetical protein
VESNPFLKKKSVLLQLSKNFNLSISPQDYMYKLQSKTSTLSIDFGGSTMGEPLKKSPLIDKILLFNNRQFDENYILKIHKIHIRFKQNPLTFYSNQAKYERKWHEKIKEEAIEAFSWKILRDIYINKLK